jgi:hypothetical protein
VAGLSVKQRSAAERADRTPLPPGRQPWRTAQRPRGPRRVVDFRTSVGGPRNARSCSALGFHGSQLAGSAANAGRFVGQTPLGGRARRPNAAGCSAIGLRASALGENRAAAARATSSRRPQEPEDPSVIREMPEVVRHSGSTAGSAPARPVLGHRWRRTLGSTPSTTSGD